MSDYNDGILPEPCLRMDTHFGYEYESVEFGDGTGYIKAAPILAKIGALHEEIDRLRDESAELRERIASNARDANTCRLVPTRNSRGPRRPMAEYVYGTDGREGHWLTGEDIVRCRDCKRFTVDQSDHDYRSGWWCKRWDTDMVEPDGFCAWGERRDA